MGAAARAPEPDYTVIWEAQDGPQTALISCPVFEVFFGGARGGGKTDGVLGDFLEHADAYGKDAIGLMIRRTRTELIETVERSRVIYTPLGWVFHEQDKMWRAPNGARLRFAYLERDADAEGYQGHSYTRLYVEEIGNFPSDKPILKLMATLRSGAGVPVGFRATGNPGGPGHQWVRARYIDQAPLGWKVLRDPVSGLERVYIPSRVSDNKFLDAQYVQQLRASGSDTLVRAWLEGDWSVVEGAFFDCWSNEKHVIAPFSVPEDWTRFRSGDWGSASPFSVGWWAIVGDNYDLGGDCGVLPRGSLVRYREWYGSSAPNVGLKLTAEQVADGIVEREAKDPKLVYGVLDPSAFKEDGGPSIGERINKVMYKAKLAGFRHADNARVSQRGAMGGWDQMRARLVGDGERPMIYTFSTCTDSIRTIPALQHDRDKPEDLDTNAEDHAADDWRYGCMSRPYMRVKPQDEKIKNRSGYKSIQDPAESFKTY
jgi:Terminase large subunit, T4likevirus-type, N-terminal